MNARSVFFQKFQALEAFVVECLRPALYLWPWIVAIAIYAFFLGSDQGEVLSWEVSEKPLANVTITAAILLTGTVLFVSCLLALVASARNYSRSQTQIRTAVGAVWIAVLCNSFGFIFAIKTGSLTAWSASFGFATLTLTVLIWTIKSAHIPNSSSINLLKFLFHHRLLFSLIAAVTALAPLVAGAVTVTSNPMWLTPFSPLLVSMIGLAFTATLFGAGLIVIPMCLQMRWIGILVFGGLFAWTITSPLAVDEENPLLKADWEAKNGKYSNTTTAIMREQDEQTCLPPPDSLENVLRSHFARIKSGSTNDHPTNVEDSRLFLVSAEGGGIRAAYWTALILGQMDIASDGEFHNRVASVSGVSGGSLGVATWLAAQERQDLLPEEKLALMKKFLQSDFLSPLLAGFLFLDVPRALLGPLWFSARRDHVFEKALADTWQEVGHTDFFARQYLNLCLKGFRYRPAVFFNATEATSGSYIPLSSTTLPSSKSIMNPERLSLESGLSRTSLKLAPLAQMVHISARFPFLSPEAEVGIETSQLAAEADAKEQLKKRDNNSEDLYAATEKNAIALSKTRDASRKQVPIPRKFARVGVLVDGGYYDNSGLTPTREALTQIAEWRKEEAEGVLRSIVHTKDAKIEVLHIVNDPGKACQPLSPSERDALSSDVHEFIQHTRLELKCDQDREKLEKSLRNNPTQWLMTPLQAALSVRERYSGTAQNRLKELRNALGLDVPIGEFSVASEFHDAYRRQKEEDEKSLRLATESLIAQRAARAKKLEVFTREAVERALVNQTVEKEAAAKFLKDLDSWAMRVRNEGAQMRCPETLEPLAPPLGWTLAKQNRDLLECLANRAAIKRDLWLPEPSFSRLIHQR